MNYKPRPGVALVSICNMPVLIPTRVAYDQCNRIQKIPVMWAILWEALSKDQPIKNVIKANMVLSKKPEAEVRKNLEEICEALYKQGFMIKTSNRDEDANMEEG